MYAVLSTRRFALSLSIVLLCTITSVAQAPTINSAGVAAIRAADEAFAKATKQSGLEGWMSFFADDAYVGMKPSVEGKPNLRQYYRGLFARRDMVLDWVPEHAEMFSSGILGYTSGKYTISFTNYQGAPVKETGAYLAVWQKQPDGTWKVLAHYGSLDAPANPPSGKATAPPAP